MKAAITIVSGLCVGLFLAFNGLTPLLEAKAVWEHRRRVMFSTLLVFAGFKFVMAAVILGAIDLALQYEVQGFILWEMILSVAVGFLVAGVLCGVVAKLIFPRPKASAHMGQMMEQIQGYIQQMMMAATQATAPSEPRAAAPTQPVADVADEVPPIPRPDERLKHPRGDINIESQVGFVH